MRANGCVWLVEMGRASLMKIAAGLVEIDDGERFLQPGTKVEIFAARA